MVSAKLAESNPQQRLIHVNRPRMLIISDSAERLSALRSGLDPGGIEINQAASIEELGRYCRVPHQIAIIDLGPEEIIDALKTLRDSREHASSHILVDVGRISTRDDLAGALPRYRAMPCRRNEIRELTRSQSSLASISSPSGNRNARGIF